MAEEVSIIRWWDANGRRQKITYGDLKASGENIRPGGGETKVPVHPKCWLSPDILTRGPSQPGERQLGLTHNTQDEATLLSSIHSTGFCPTASCQLPQEDRKTALWEKRAEQG